MLGMRIVLMGQMQSKGYSGGRYHAWVMAEAMASMGMDVFFVTNARPELAKNFEIYEHHNRIKLILNYDFYNLRLPIDKADYCILATSQSLDMEYITVWKELAFRLEAILAFINYESPNWYKAVCGKMITRSEKSYRLLKKACRGGCLIFCSAEESRKYAREYYNLDSKRTYFEVWAPAINSKKADMISEDRQNQIIVFIRARDKHKGGDDFLELLDSYLFGIKIVCINGTAGSDADFLDMAMKKAKNYHIILEFKEALSDEEKFREMKRSKVLLFPSYFEGYGYPPIEAIYCGTSCIAYDLPVLRETVGNMAEFIPVGDVVALRHRLENILKHGEFTVKHRPDTAEFDKQAERLGEILRCNLELRDVFKTSVIKRMLTELRLVIYRMRKTKEKQVPVISYLIDNGTAALTKKIKMDERSWDYIAREVLPLSKVYIWGCGDAYRQLYPVLLTNVKIEGLIDTGLAGCYDTYTGKYIELPDELDELDPTQLFILISPLFHIDEIVDALEKKGITRYLSLCLQAYGIKSERKVS